MANSTCSHEHILNWQSQPLVKDVGAGNLIVAAAILFCAFGISNSELQQSNQTKYH